jgi:hypothetical protein
MVANNPRLAQAGYRKSQLPHALLIYFQLRPHKILKPRFLNHYMQSYA